MSETFGTLLKKYRMQTTNPKKRTKKNDTHQNSCLSINKLAKLTRERQTPPGTYPSHATIGAWETEDRKPPPSDRRKTLIAVLSVLWEYGGIESASDANLLLRECNQKDLSKSEMKYVFFGDYQPQQQAQNEVNPSIQFEQGSDIYQAINLDLKHGNAHRALQQLEKYSQKYPNGQSSSDFIRLRGKAHLILGDLAQAKADLMRLKTIAEENTNRVLEMEANINLGILVMRQFEWRAAYKYLNKAIRLAEIHQSKIHRAYAYAALAAVYTERKLWGQAKKNYNKALPIAEKLQQHNLEFSIKFNQAVLDYYQNEVDESSILWAKTLYDIAESSGYKEYIVRSQWLLGASYATIGEQYLAEGHIKNGIALANKLGFQGIKVTLYIELAKIFIRDRHFSDATNILDELFNNQSTPLSNSQMSMILYGKGLVRSLSDSFIGHGDLDRARQIVNPIVKSLSNEAIKSVSIQSLESAQDFFSYGLVNYPDLERYMVVEAISEHLNHPTSYTS